MLQQFAIGVQDARVLAVYFIREARAFNDFREPALDEVGLFPSGASSNVAMNMSIA